MKDKTIVYYYSKTGNNRYLASKIAELLKCDIEEIRPRINIFPLQLLFALTKIDAGIKKLKNHPKDYDTCILCGPSWFGTPAPSLSGLMRSYDKGIKRAHMITCCGSSDEKKDDKFGYEETFRNIKARFQRISSCTAIPVTLVLSKNDKDNSDAMMKARLNDGNFKGELKKRVEKFTRSIMDDR